MNNDSFGPEGGHSFSHSLLLRSSTRQIALSTQNKISVGLDLTNRDMEVTLKTIKCTQHFAMFRDILLANLRVVIWYIDSLECREAWRKPWLIPLSTHYLFRAWHSYVLAYHILSTSQFIIVPADIPVRTSHFTRCSYWDIYRHSKCHISGHVYITLTSYSRHGVSNHWQVDCLFNSIGNIKRRIIGRLWEGCFPHTGDQ